MIKINSYIAMILSLLCGIWMLFAGYAHLFTMGYEFTMMPEFSSLNKQASDLLILMTQAVGILLLATGGWTCYFSFKLKIGDRLAKYYSLSMSILFLGRTILEALHPVAVPVPRPEVLIHVASIFILFLLAYILVEVNDITARGKLNG